jgi:hypothetical protein
MIKTKELMDATFGMALLDFAEQSPLLLDEKWMLLRVPDYVGRRRCRVTTNLLTHSFLLEAGEFYVSLHRKFYEERRFVQAGVRSVTAEIYITLGEEEVPKEEEKLYDLLWERTEVYGIGKGLLRRNREIILMAWQHLVLICPTVPEIEDIDGIYDFDA